MPKFKLEYFENFWIGHASIKSKESFNLSIPTKIKKQYNIKKENKFITIPTSKNMKFKINDYIGFYIIKEDTITWLQGKVIRNKEGYYYNDEEYKEEEEEEKEEEKEDLKYNKNKKYALLDVTYIFIDTDDNKPNILFQFNNLNSTYGFKKFKSAEEIGDETIICPKCKSQYPNNFNYCYNCGYKKIKGENKND